MTRSEYEALRALVIKHGETAAVLAAESWSLSVFIRDMQS